MLENFATQPILNNFGSYNAEKQLESFLKTNSSKKQSRLCHAAII